MEGGFRLIAHRGASAHAPENTLPAFDLALEHGAREVELDVRFSADEELVVFHDDALDRKTALRGRVRHYPADVLYQTDIGRWFDRTHAEADRRYEGTSICGLAAIFGRLGSGVRYHVEMKGFEDLLALRLLEMIDRFGLREVVTVTSFSMRPLLQMRRLAPELPLCLLLRDAFDAVRSAEFRPELEGKSVEAVQEYWIDQAASSDFQQIGVRAARLSPRTAAHAAARGLEVRGWGVRTEADLLHLFDLGAVGTTVDWPRRAGEILRAKRRSPEGERSERSPD